MAPSEEKVQLRTLLAALDEWRVEGRPEVQALSGAGDALAALAGVEVNGIAYDSRAVRPGELFVAVRGTRDDGHRYAPEAVSRGAVAVVGEEPVAVPPGVVQVIVPDSRLALSRLSAAFFGWPSRKLRVIGVTGTKGKTSTTYLIKAVLEAAGEKVGLIGTIRNLIGDEILPAHRTTPESADLQSLLRRMADRGVDSVVMEVSSHALSLHRVADVSFDVGVFTNIGRDHLDFHQSFQEYLEAKKLLFRSLARGREATGGVGKGTRFAVINRDSPVWHEVAQAAAGVPIYTFGIDSKEADVQATIERIALNGTLVKLRMPRPWPVGAGDSPEVGGPAGVAGPVAAESALGAGSPGVARAVPAAEAGATPVEIPLVLQLIGKFNVYNSLAAATVGLGLGLPLEVVVAGLERVPGIPGRFQRVLPGHPFEVVVDYAHTPDSLAQVLQAARELHPRRLLVVFGCGGDRDRGKRPLMGAVAARLANRVYITSDNPRSEDPEAICREIEQGYVQETQRQSEGYRVIVDRREAIRQAIEEARPGDLVVIAGKGHETYQEFAHGRIHFDDVEVARQILEGKAEGDARGTGR